MRHQQRGQWRRHSLQQTALKQQLGSLYHIQATPSQMFFQVEAEDSAAPALFTSLCKRRGAHQQRGRRQQRGLRGLDFGQVGAVNLERLRQAGADARDRLGRRRQRQRLLHDGLWRAEEHREG